MLISSLCSHHVCFHDFVLRFEQMLSLILWWLCFSGVEFGDDVFIFWHALLNLVLREVACVFVLWFWHFRVVAQAL